MNQKKVLGRGLGALIPQRGDLDPLRDGLAQIPITQITPNPYQPRKAFNEASIEELARSVREHGIVQPIVVTRTSGSHYRLIAGERRLRAAQRAGLQTVPAVIKELLKEGDSLQIALIENIQREDLNPIEEAGAYHQLHDEFGLTQEEISRRVGKERSTVANFLRLLRLPDSVKELLAAGQLTMGHARALLSVDSAKRQEQLAERVVKSNLNVRQTEMLAATTSAKPAKRAKPKDVFTRDAEEKLTRSLRTKVDIDRRRRGGVIHIRFASEDDLIRIFDELTGRRR
ncbi:MAG: chromosome partitioning protein ParB [Acidobacteria bacterium]|nr:MAG: chromosome partitioning protein ParB [Acidobacteriota bacterium]